MHRVLKISTENAFCLHSKERVPFHIIVEVAYDPEVEEAESEEEEKELSGVDGANENPFLEDARKGGLKIKELKIKSVEKLKSLAAGGLGKSEQKAIELTGTRKSNSNKGNGAG
jgi:hypothetical protein